MRVMTFVGTRPEIIKLSRVLPALDKYFEHTLVHTDQNWAPQLNEDIFKDLKLRKPDDRFFVGKPVIDGPPKPPCEVTAEILLHAGDILEKYKPDAVLVLGDTNSALAAAYAAKRHKIPLFHMEAGNRCFDDRTPEEVNRRIVDTIADVNLPYTEHARRNLLASGCREDRIVKTGSPMREVLNYYSDEIARSNVMLALDLKPRGYYLVSAHREENVDDPKRLYALGDMLNTLSAHGQVIVSVHPRLSPKVMKSVLSPNVRLHQPFGFFDYCQLQQNAECVISDSGTLTEEAAILGFPAVMIRQAHERPEGMDEGVVLMADFLRVLEAVKLVVARGPSRLPEDYQAENVSRKVVNTIVSYTDHIRRTVWQQ